MPVTMTEAEAPVGEQEFHAPNVIFTVLLMCVVFCTIFILCWWRERAESKRRFKEMQQQLHEARSETLAFSPTRLTYRESQRIRPALEGPMVRRKEESEASEHPSVRGIYELLQDGVAVHVEEEAPTSIEDRINLLLRSREAGEEHSPTQRHDLVKNGIRVLNADEMLAAKEGDGVNEGQLSPLAPKELIALAGVWRTSRGLTVEVTSEGAVKGTYGNSAMLLLLHGWGDTGETCLVLRSGFRAMRLLGEVLLGPAPQNLSWADGSVWIRTDKAEVQPSRDSLPASPVGLAPGLRVNTDLGRGTLIRNYAVIDSTPYWHVRLDSEPMSQRLVSTFNIIPLPWLHQDLISQPQMGLRADGFEEFHEHDVRESVAAQKAIEQEIKEYQRDHARQTAIEDALRAAHVEITTKKRKQRRTVVPRAVVYPPDGSFPDV